LTAENAEHAEKLTAENSENAEELTAEKAGVDRREHRPI